MSVPFQFFQYLCHPERSEGPAFLSDAREPPPCPDTSAKIIKRMSVTLPQLALGICSSPRAQHSHKPSRIQPHRQRHLPRKKLPLPSPHPHSHLQRHRRTIRPHRLPHLFPDKQYIVESMSGGVGVIDCDNDGKLDIVTVNGSTVDRYRKKAATRSSRSTTRMPTSNSPNIHRHHQRRTHSQRLGHGRCRRRLRQRRHARSLRHRLRRQCALSQLGQLQIRRRHR